MATVIKALVDAMNAHDVERLVSLFHPDYRSEQPSHPTRGFDTSRQVRANWSAMFAGIPDFHAEVIRMVDDGDTCWSEWQWWGTRTDGAPFEMRGVTLFQLREDHIAAGRLYMEPVEQDGEDIAEAVRRMSGHTPG
jgi:ketosteroid isomerase-like protein